jgi:hypothetical protein
MERRRRRENRVVSLETREVCDDPTALHIVLATAGLWVGVSFWVDVFSSFASRSDSASSRPSATLTSGAMAVRYSANSLLTCSF